MEEEALIVKRETLYPQNNRKYVWIALPPLSKAYLSLWKMWTYLKEENLDWEYSWRDFLLPEDNSQGEVFL